MRCCSAANAMRSSQDAARNEGALEANEGDRAGYTGVRVIGLTSSAERTAFAVDSLKPYTPDATFVRSFALS